VTTEVAGNPEPVEITEGERPKLRRVEPPAQPQGPRPQESLTLDRATASGRFVELECHKKEAHMIVETAVGRKVFLIEDPEKVAIIAGNDGPVEMACGKQKTPVRVEVGYDRLPANPSVDGVVRTVAF
jgi:hypothetical protein